MAPINLYDASIALFIRGHVSLIGVLKKASEATNADSLPGARLIEDMHPLIKQVQFISDTSKNTVERLTGTKVGVWEDNEKTLPELIARAEKTLALLQSVDAKAIEGIEDKIVPMKMGPKSMELPALSYVVGFAVPNIFFHFGMAYAILRSNGIQIGKRDWLGPYMGPVTEGIESK